MRIKVAIPARLESTRLKHKMLIECCGKPLIRHVYDRLCNMGLDVTVVTDSPKIGEHIPSEDVLYSLEAENGTDRLSQFVWDCDYLINVQGDMADITWETLKPLIDACDGEADIITAYTKGCELRDVKVLHQYGKALWFERLGNMGDRHLGIYAYKPEVLDEYELMSDKYPGLKLEQTRFLGAYDIKVVETIYEGVEINTQADVDRWTM